jgi:hypothetical protein
VFSPAIDRLVGLGVVSLLSIGVVLLLLRWSGQRVPRGAIVSGYPPDLFPAQHLVSSGPLAALAATQARLSSIERQLPPQGYLSIWLRTFLIELRAIMDTAYRVMAITEIYGKPAQLDQLVAEVQQIEAEIATQVTHQLLTRNGNDSPDELLEGRLAILRLCVRELADNGPWTMDDG